MDQAEALDILSQRFALPLSDGEEVAACSRLGERPRKFCAGTKKVLNRNVAALFLKLTRGDGHGKLRTHHTKVQSHK